MKIISILLFLAISILADNLPGTNAASMLVPVSPGDTFHAVTWQKYHKGGWHQGYDTNSRNAVPSAYRDSGMVYFCYKDSSLWQLRGGIANSNWKSFGSLSLSGTPGYIPEFVAANQVGNSPLRDSAGIIVDTSMGARAELAKYYAKYFARIDIKSSDSGYASINLGSDSSSINYQSYGSHANVSTTIMGYPLKGMSRIAMSSTMGSASTIYSAGGSLAFGAYGLGTQPRKSFWIDTSGNFYDSATATYFKGKTVSINPTYNSTMYIDSSVLEIGHANGYFGDGTIYFTGDGYINSGKNRNSVWNLGLNYTGYHCDTSQFRGLNIYDGKRNLISSVDAPNKTWIFYGPVLLNNGALNFGTNDSLTDIAHLPYWNGIPLGLQTGSAITGSGVANYMAKWGSTTGLGYSSLLSEDATTLRDSGNFIATGSITSANSIYWDAAYAWGNWASNFGSSSGTICQGNDSRLSDARPASDVYSWAKASTKPSYTYSEVGADVSGAATSAVNAAVNGGNDYLAKFCCVDIAAHTIVNSIIYDNGTKVGIGTTEPDSQLTTKGGIHDSGGLLVEGKTTLKDTLKINSGGFLFYSAPFLHLEANSALVCQSFNSDAYFRVTGTTGNGTLFLNNENGSVSSGGIWEETKHGPITLRANGGENSIKLEAINPSTLTGTRITIDSAGGIYTDPYQDWSSHVTVYGFASATIEEHYAKLGKRVDVFFTITGLSNDVNVGFDLPYPSTSFIYGTCIGVNNVGAGGFEEACQISISNGSDIAHVYRLGGQVWTAILNKLVQGQITYYTDQ